MAQEARLTLRHMQILRRRKPSNKLNLNMVDMAQIVNQCSTSTAQWEKVVASSTEPLLLLATCCIGQ